MGKFTFGCPVTNIYASVDNPQRVSWFVKRNKDTITITDKQGNFWDVHSDAIVDGHLNAHVVTIK